MGIAHQVKTGRRVKLAKHDPEGPADVTRERVDRELQRLSDAVGEMQELMFAARRNSLLVVLQGMDTSGKDGTIKHVMSEVNPQGCRVESFKVPTEEELSHDFLWRVHKVVPPVGMVTIFNRSHYEDVLVVRVRELAPEEVWRMRYDHINGFEKLLADNGTIILKFFLHISSEEQEKRLLQREEDTKKAWKLSAGDWREREYWAEYMRAYEDALSTCSTDYAPWFVVPANRKWLRNLAVATEIERALKKRTGEWRDSLDRLAGVKLEELRALRAEKRALR